MCFGPGCSEYIVICKRYSWEAHPLRTSTKTFSVSYMLIGEHLHTLDDKKRLSLPAKFRKELGASVVITRGLDACLFVYSKAEWVIFSGRLAELSMGQADSRAFNRFLLAGAVESAVDKSGRILVPDFLKEFAHLEERVVVAGMYNRVELWNEKTWEVYKGRVEKQADTLAEKLGEIGMI
ncbi:MAG: MraZ protein [Planctomycetota bacterium]|jgi:MraZ protein